MAGGKRKGAGRPPGSTNQKLSNWVKVATTISPESKAYLSAKKAEGVKVNIMIDKAIKLMMAQDS